MPLYAILDAATAQTVVAQVQKYYASVQHVRGTFTEKVVNNTFGTNDTNEGKVYAEKPDHARLEYLDKKGGTKRYFVTDGKTVWMVDAVNKVVRTGPVSGRAELTAFAFLSNGNLTADYNVTLTGSTILELVPKTKSTVAKLMLVVDTSDGHVTESIVTNANGDTDDFTWTLDPKGDVSSSWFSVDPNKLPSTYTVEQLGSAPATPAKTTTPPAKKP